MLSRDPVLVIDDHRLIKTTAALPPGGMDHVIPPGTARLVRAGRDVTVVAWGYGLQRVLAVVEQIEAEGISVEVIDPRWLDRASFDRAAVLASVARTGALVIVEDAQRSLSMGSQILDYLLPDVFGHLRAAPLRVTGEFTRRSRSRARDARPPARRERRPGDQDRGRSRQRNRDERSDAAGMPNVGAGRRPARSSRWLPCRRRRGRRR
jgi:2-oxoisovalerate dehydrogenase E1 component